MLKDRIKILIVKFVFVLSNILIQFLGVRVLTKEQFGIFSVGKSILQLYDFTHLGTRYALDRLLPMARSYTRMILYSTSYIITLVSSLFLSIIWIVIGYNSVYYLLFSFSGVLYSILTLKKIYERSKGDYKAFNRLIIIVDVTTSVLQIIGLIVAGLGGLTWSLFLGYLLIFLLVDGVQFFRRLRIVLLSSDRMKKRTKQLFKIGFILLINSIILYMVSSADRIIIERKYGPEFLAEYSFVSMFLTLLIMIPSTLIEIQMSRLMLDTTRRKYFLFSGVVIILVLVGCIFIYLGQPYYLGYFPKYDHLGHEITIISFAAVFSALAQIAIIYFQATDQRRNILIANVIAASVYLVRLLIISERGGGLEKLIWNKNVYFLFLIFMLLMLFGIGALRSRHKSG